MEKTSQFLLFALPLSWIMVFEYQADEFVKMISTAVHSCCTVKWNTLTHLIWRCKSGMSTWRQPKSVIYHCTMWERVNRNPPSGYNGRINKKTNYKIPLNVCLSICLLRYLTKFSFKSMCRIVIKYTLGYKFVCIIDADVIESILQA